MPRLDGLLYDAVAGAMIAGTFFHQPFQPAFQHEEVCGGRSPAGALQVAGAEIFAEQISLEPDALAGVGPDDRQIIQPRAREREALLFEISNDVATAADLAGLGLCLHLLGKRLANI